MMFLVRSANFQRWFLQTEYGSALSNLLPFYQPKVEFRVIMITFMLPTISHFELDWPTSRGGFHKPSPYLTSLTFYQHVV